MTKIYMLPDGAEVREADGNLLSTPTLANHSWVIHPTLGAISCYTGLLSPVTPPLPAEPPPNSIVMVTSQAYGDAYMGYRNVWFHHPSFGGWVCFGDREHHVTPWAHVCASGEQWAVLVPDPAVESPDLPWSDLARDIQVRIQYGGIGDPYLEVDLLEDAVTYHADDGLKDLDQLIGALSRGRAKLHAELNGSAPSAMDPAEAERIFDEGSAALRAVRRTELDLAKEDTTDAHR
jgi:hypothetical protein